MRRKYNFSLYRKTSQTSCSSCKCLWGCSNDGYVPELSRLKHIFIFTSFTFTTNAHGCISLWAGNWTTFLDGWVLQEILCPKDRGHQDTKPRDKADGFSRLLCCRLWGPSREELREQDASRCAATEQGWKLQPWNSPAVEMVLFLSLLLHILPFKLKGVISFPPSLSSS